MLKHPLHSLPSTVGCWLSTSTFHVCLVFTRRELGLIYTEGVLSATRETPLQPGRISVRWKPISISLITSSLFVRLSPPATPLKFRAFLRYGSLSFFNIAPHLQFIFQSSRNFLHFLSGPKPASVDFKIRCRVCVPVYTHEHIFVVLS